LLRSVIAIALRHQAARFQRQIFGQKSERRIVESTGMQGSLGEPFDALPETLLPAKKQRIDAYERQSKTRGFSSDSADE